MDRYHGLGLGRSVYRQGGMGFFPSRTEERECLGGLESRGEKGSGSFDLVSIDPFSVLRPSMADGPCFGSDDDIYKQDALV